MMFPQLDPEFSLCSDFRSCVGPRRTRTHHQIDYSPVLYPHHPASNMSASITSTSTPPNPSSPQNDSPPPFWEALFSSIFTPEYNTVAQKIMNFSFYGLFLVLTILVFLTNYNPHVIALLTMAIGLWMSVNWFMKELAKLPASSKEVQQMPAAEESKKDL
ncbi:V-type ATPase assembly factor PKR1 [Pseudozyma hubeiensis]|nr:V-type ATPase assembly factor PKR1 [Pseudozyma hubeiensis]